MSKNNQKRTFEAAIVCASYNCDSANQLAERLRERMGSSDRVWVSSRSADATPASIACGVARTVVVLYDRLWEGSELSADDVAAVQARAKSEPSTLIFVSVDGSSAPAWARKARFFDAGTASVDDCVDAIFGVIRRNGGDVGEEPDADVASREAKTEKYGRDRDAYLGSHRSGPACSRELERLTDDIIERAEGLRGHLEGEVAITRGVGRSIIQLGQTALTVSWIRSRTDAVIEGRLMIMEWDGVVRRGNEHSPERGSSRANVRPPTLLAEEIYVADASTEQGWRWRREGCSLGTYTSVDLAERCMASVTTRLGDRTAVEA